MATPSDLLPLIEAQLQQLQAALLSSDPLALEQGAQTLREAAAALATLPRRVRPRLRDPAQITDLLAYTLVGGVVDAARPDHLPLHLEFDPRGDLP